MRVYWSQIASGFGLARSTGRGSGIAHADIPQSSPPATSAPIRPSPALRTTCEDGPNLWGATRLDDIRGHNHVLTPGRYVGMAEVEEDDEPFEEKMERLTAGLRQQMAQAARLDQRIWSNLQEAGYGR